MAAGDLEGRLAQVEAQLGQQASAHAAELQQLRQRHAEELDNVQARFVQASVVPCSCYFAGRCEQGILAASSLLTLRVTSGHPAPTKGSSLEHEQHDLTVAGDSSQGGDHQ